MNTVRSLVTVALLMLLLMVGCKKDDGNGNTNSAFRPDIRSITSGLQPNSLFSLAINGDGRFIVFSTTVKLSAQDTDDFYDVYRYDRLNNTTTLISTNLVSNSFGVSITDDGSRILYTASQSPDQGQNQDESATAIYLWENGTIQTVTEGQQDPFMPWVSFTPLVAYSNIISPDGNFIAATVDLNHFVYDINTQQSTLISNGQPSDFSTDGRYHTWVDVDILSPGESPQVWRYDRLTQENIPITNSTKYSGEPRISGDGSLVVFESELGTLTGAEDNNGLQDVFLFTATTPRYDRLSTANANGNSSFPDISADGQVIAFASEANSLGLVDNNLLSDIILRINGQFTNITGNADGPSSLPRVSSDGNWVVFVSAATNLPNGTAAPNIYIAGPLRQ